MNKQAIPQESTRLAQVIAAEHFIYQGVDCTMPGELIYSLAISDSFDTHGFEATEDYRDYNEIGVTQKMREMAFTMQNHLNNYRDNIANGLMIFTLCDRPLTNGVTFDVDQFALLGSLIYVTVEVDGVPFRLDSSKAQWVGVNDSSVTHDIDFSEYGNFMPKTTGEKVLISGINGELRYIVDQSSDHNINTVNLSDDRVAYLNAADELAKERYGKVACNLIKDSDLANKLLLDGFYNSVPVPDILHSIRLIEAGQRWDALSNIPVNEDDELEEPFLHFGIGTDRYDVWRYIETEYNCSVAKDLMGIA